MKHLFALFTGLGFGTGIAISGMMDPAKVLNFFDIAGTWDPSLICVMGGALIVPFLGYRMVWRRSKPLFAEGFQLPTSARIDSKLIGGAALFGVGWGIAGFCPGGALPALGTGDPSVMMFVAALTVGIWVATWAQRRVLVAA